MTKWQNGTKDKSQSYKVLLFHWNLHLLPNLFCGFIATNKRNIYNHKFAVAVRHGPFGNFNFSVPPLTGCRLPPRIFLIKMTTFIWEENDFFMNYLRFTVDITLWAPAFTWNGLWKRNRLRNDVYTRYLANTYFARKQSDVGCLYQIDKK